MCDVQGCTNASIGKAHVRMETPLGTMENEVSLCAEHMANISGKHQAYSMGCHHSTSDQSTQEYVQETPQEEKVIRILVLDDMQTRLKTFRQKLIGSVVVCVEHAADCIKELEDNGPFDYLFLDHDLDGKIYVPSGPGTGYEVALWLKNNPDKKPKNIILHTCNEKGIVRMKEELPEALCLSGVFMVDFSLSDLDNLENLYTRHIQML